MQIPRPKTLFVGQRVVYLDEASSTNDYLRELMTNEKVQEGTLVIADFQREGKGQKGRIWQSEPGVNALFSILLRPGFMEKTGVQMLSSVIGLGIRAAVQQLLPDCEVRLKWPNDLLVDGKKVGGILIENLMGESITAVVGVGLNVGQTHFSGLDNAVSINQLALNQSSVSDVIASCCEFIEKYYLLTRQTQGLQQIHRLYVSQLYKLDEEVEIASEAWTIKGVSETGKLMVQRQDKYRELVHNEVPITWN